MNDTFFSDSYSTARKRFREAASDAGAALHCYPMEASSGEEWSMDVAVLGDSHLPTVVTSSGVHGVEGFVGSAVQLALLGQLKSSAGRAKVRHVFIHAVNPFGFAKLRRFNEDNVDLNRNFLNNASDYQGAPDGYVRLNEFLNPESPPSRMEPFHLRAAGKIWRHGMQTLKEAIAGGQYEYPRGIFFGGSEPSWSMRTISQHCEQWISDSQRIIHLDFHTGLGKHGEYKLLVGPEASADHDGWYESTFGATAVELSDRTNPTAYVASGTLEQWMQSRFRHREYRSTTVEFGTHNVIRVLAALRAENRAHHHGIVDSPSYHRAKQELLECFCPRAPSWRECVVKSSLAIIDQATLGILRPTG
ncbi:DUF2817 domain-containing protein [Stieleria varia]|uniref:Zinc carboxypeptidase n=1 Tax=Stieleria varia TaxID=2528005 RepID=A0A5C6B7G3_9BACT|nr:DUF2817 domain-containing protein [Stieleria varia]TWU06444.1 Zinc carboxypeptidase [Stieleria varia]